MTSPIPFTPGEINILCTDLKRSLRFYRDVLGFEVTAQEVGAVHLRSGLHAYLLLPFAQQARPDVPYGARAEFSLDLTVPDLAAAAAHLKAQGVTFARPWQPDAASVIIHDPDGLVWEIIQQGN